MKSALELSTNGLEKELDIANQLIEAQKKLILFLKEDLEKANKIAVIHEEIQEISKMYISQLEAVQKFPLECYSRAYK